MIRYSIPGPLVSLVFVRRPVSDPRPDNTMCFVDSGTGTTWRNGQGVGLWKDGAWTNGKGKPLSFEPTYWTVLEDKAHA